MTEDNTKQVLDLFDGKLVKQDDLGIVDFDKPIKGAYKARIVSLKRYSGENDKCETGVYDMWSLNFQVEETLEGDKGTNRYLSKTYSNVVGKYQESAEEGCIKLANDLFTAGILQECNITEKDKMKIIEEIAPQIVDKIINVRAYGRKDKQICRIVKELKVDKPTDTSDGDDW